MNDRLAKAIQDTFKKRDAQATEPRWVCNYSSKQELASEKAYAFSAQLWSASTRSSQEPRVFVLDESLLQAPLRVAALEGELATAKAEIAATQREIRALRTQIEGLTSQERFRLGYECHFHPSETKASIDAVTEFTSRLFATTPLIATIVDPETGKRSFEVVVDAEGGSGELISKSDRWHREIQAVAGVLSHLYSLSLMPTDESK